MFIVFEGIDGSGKSTQLDLFCKWLGENQVPNVRCADPGTTQLGNALRNILLQRTEVPICPVGEMLMFMTARSQMVDELIRPALDQNKTVVCDRFVMSTAVYQGYAGKLDRTEIDDVARIATGALVPD